MRTALILAGLALTMLPSGAGAMMPLARPSPTDAVENGRSAPFVGAWSMRLPTMEVSEPDTMLAACTQPVRITAADDTHIFYLNPEESEAQAATELIPRDQGTFWSPIAGGPSYFAFWIDADNFYLYDELPQTDADWGRPYIYQRCD